MQAKRGIDHIVHCVRDLDAAIARFEALGFTLTPRALHPFGTGNALVQMQGCFIELLAIVEPEKIAAATTGGFGFGPFCRDYLARREGMAMLVFESGDAHADRADFIAGGLATYPVFDFSRKARLPDGGEATVAFSLAFVTHEAMPQATFFTCQQHAPEHFWKPDYQRHANGARAIAEIVMVADDPGAWRKFFEGMQGAGSTRLDGDRLTIETARGKVTVLTQDAFAVRFPGETAPTEREGPVFAAAIVGVSDVEMLREMFASEQILVRDSADGKLFVPAAETFGLAMGFCE